MKQLKHSIIINFSCILILICSCVVVNAGTNTEVNDVARELLSEYYQPTYCLNTCMYNIENCYSQQEYTNTDQLDDIYDTAESITSKMTNDKDKVKAIHDWMCENIDYATSTEGYNGYPYSDLANPFTVYKNKQAVCYGFSNLTQMMLQHLNIPCVIVRGNYSSHVWNAVYIDGKWVFTDNTWDENLSKENNISYKYYLMTDDTYDNTYKTEYIENWAGDACYFPTYVTTKYKYHSIILNSKGGNCVSKIPFSENMSNFTIPEPNREGRTFLRWNNDHDIYCYYYKPFGGWYIRGPNSVTEEQEAAGITISSGVKGITEDIIFTAQYSKVNPTYEIPTNIIAYTGDTLSNVVLPEGFSWVDDTQILNDTGIYTFKATYTPSDLDDYNVVNNIDISIEVKELSSKIIEESKNLLTNINNNLKTTQDYHNNYKSTINSNKTLYNSELQYTTNSINSLKGLDNTIKQSLDETNDSITSAEQLYEKYKQGQVSDTEVKNAINSANSKINSLNTDIGSLNTEIEKISLYKNNWNSVESLWSTNDINNQISKLNSDLVNVQNTLIGLNNYLNSNDNINKEEVNKLIEDLEAVEVEIKNRIDLYTEDINNGNGVIESITINRNNLDTQIGISKTTITSINIADMKARLNKISKFYTNLTTSMVKLSYYTATYNGKAIKPNVTVNGYTLNKDYTVKYYNNTYIGQGKVIITGINNCRGTITKTFNIVTPKPLIKKLVRYKKNRCKIYVKPLSGVSKYRVAYRIKGKKKWSYKTITAKKNIVTLTKLKHKKRYQIKVAAVCPTNSGIKYSEYSNTKTIKLK